MDEVRADDDDGEGEREVGGDRGFVDVEEEDSEDDEDEITAEVVVGAW